MADSVDRERVQGSGGLLFRSADPEALVPGYKRRLGIDPVPTDEDHPAWQHDLEGNPVELWGPMQPGERP
jgi:hypothetical protein